MTMNLTLTVLLAGAVLAQAGPSQDAVAALKASLAENQAKLRTYTWVESTEVSVKGEVKKKEQKQCYYGADGKVQKTPIPAAAPVAQESRSGGGGRRGGRVAQAIVENKVDDMKDYIEKVVALVGQYVPPDPAKIDAAKTAGKVSAQPAGGTMNLQIKDYVKAGDTLAIGLDTAAKLLSTYRVQSFVEKPKDDDVNLTVTFARLQDGTSYPQKIVLDVAAKKVQVTVTNSGYKKAGA